MESFIEAWLNTLIGFVVSVSIWPIAAWINGVESTFSQNIGMTVVFTGVSVLRSYAIRRWCNAYLHKLTKWIAGKLTA